jgi:hypothetical protein
MPGPSDLSDVRVAHKIFTPGGGAFRFLQITCRSRLAPGEIQVTLFDQQGRKVAAPPARTSGPDILIAWDGRREGGEDAPAGIYIYEIKAGAAAYRGAVVLAR